MSSDILNLSNLEEFDLSSNPPKNVISNLNEITNTNENNINESLKVNLMVPNNQSVDISINKNIETNIETKENFQDYNSMDYEGLPYTDYNNSPSPSQTGGSSANSVNNTNSSNNTNSEESSEIKNEFLNLSRGDLIKIKDDLKNFIITQIQDSFFNIKVNSLDKRYGIREVNDTGKVGIKLTQINSSDIKEVLTFNDIKLKKTDIEYENLDDKDLDTEQNKFFESMENIDPTISSPPELEFWEKNLSGIDLNDLDASEDTNVDIGESSENTQTNDEEGYEFEEIMDNDLLLDIQQELEETKVLFTENEQEEDIIDELVRMNTSKKINYREIINKVRNFKYLKFKYSQHGLPENMNLPEDRLTELKQKFHIKGSNYKPLVNEYMNNNFENKSFIPILDYKFRNYNNEDDNDEQKYNQEIINQIKNIENINLKYKKNIELPYNNKLHDIEREVQDKFIENDHNGFISRMKMDTLSFVKNNINDNKINEVKILGQDTLINEYGESKVINKGELNSLVGFIKFPNSNELKTNDYRNYIAEYLSYDTTQYSEIFEKYKLTENINIEVLDKNMIYKKNEKVKICIYNNNDDFSFIGTVKGSKKNYIYVEPLDNSIIDKTTKILEFDTSLKSLKIDKLYDIKQEHLNCLNNENEKVKIFLFPDGKITDNHKLNILRQIIPNALQVLLLEKNKINKITNYHQLEKILGKYSIDYIDMDIKCKSIIDDILDENISNISKIYNKKSKHFKNYKENYDKLCEETYKVNKSNDYNFISNSNINELNKYYEKYLYDKFSFDNDLQRLRWVHEQEDYGKLMAYYCLNKIYSKKTEKDYSKELQDKLNTLVAEGERLNAKLIDEKQKNNFFKPDTQNNCNENVKEENRIVKIYKTLEELENDNNKDIMADEEFKSGLDMKVKEGDFCVLKSDGDLNTNLNGNEVLYIRKIVDSNPVWENISSKKNKEGKKINKEALIKLIKNYRDKCNRNITTNVENCKMEESFGPCVPERVLRLKISLKNNIDEINELNTEIERFNLEKNSLLSKKKNKIENRFEYLKRRGKLNLLKIKNIKDNKIKEVHDYRNSIVLKVNTDELKDFEQLKQIEEGLKDPIKRNEILMEMKDKYGIDYFDEVFIEGEDKELFTMGDFNKQGQRVILTENISNEREDIKLSNNQLLDSIKTFLKEATIIAEDEESDVLSIIRNIVSTIVGIMGVTIDEDDLSRNCMISVDEKVADMAEYLYNKYTRKGKKQPKKSKLEEEYNNFKNQNIILITGAKLLIYLQLNLNNYFMLPYQKCISSINGFPITDKDNMEGIEFITCILQNLSKSGNYWTSIKDLKKSKIKDKLFTFTEYFSSSTMEQRLLEKKRIELENKRKEYEELESNYPWLEFRPFLKGTFENLKEPLNMDLKDLKTINYHNIKKANKTLEERRNWLSFKIIDKINNIINSSNIENIQYDPLPISNSCCLSLINNKYNYFNYFNSNDKSEELKKYLEKSIELEKLKIFEENESITFIKPFLSRNKLKSYQKNIFPSSNKEIKSQEDLRLLLFRKFVYYSDSLNNDEYRELVFQNNGNKRIFNNEDICQLTCEHLHNIKLKNYTLNDYNILLNTIHKKNEINYEKINEKKTVEQLRLEKLKNLNKIDFLKKNKFIHDMCNNELDSLNEKNILEVNRYWSMLDVEIELQKEKLIETIESRKNKKEVKIFTEKLNKLGILEKHEEEEKKTFSKEIQLQKKYLRFNKILMEYIIYIRNYISVLSKANPYLTMESNELLYNFDDYNFIRNDKFIGKTKIFKKILHLTKNLDLISNIAGYDDIKDCEDKVVSHSKFMVKTSSKLVNLILYILINSILDSKDNKTEEDVLTNFIYEMVIKLENDNKFKNKYSKLYAEKEIKVINEEHKDKNLYVMELLDNETRKLRNEMTSCGLTEYKNLAKDFEDVLDKEDNDKKLRIRCMELYGDNFTDAQLDNLREEQNNQARIEAEIHEDNEIYEDAEGDEEMGVF